jgi:hypothetical protein
MSKLEDAKKILKELGLPTAQQNEISAYTLLAFCGIRPRDSWSKATRKSLKFTKGIMAFVLDIHKKGYAPDNTHSADGSFFGFLFQTTAHTSQPKEI